MSDNVWRVLFDGSRVPAAAAPPSGHHFYRLVVSIKGDAGVLNAYKAAPSRARARSARSRTSSA